MTSYQLKCSTCGAFHQPSREILLCPSCKNRQQAGQPLCGVLQVSLLSLPSTWPPAASTSAELAPGRAHWRWRDFLPISKNAVLPPFDTHGAALSPAPRLATRLGQKHLFLKDDTRLPTGSTKDRASWLVATKAIEYGFNVVATASTGNAATALAGVAATCDLEAVVFVPATAPKAKLLQMSSYGARVITVDGSYDDAFSLCAKACDELGWYNRNTALNPYTIEGKKTLGLELALDASRMVPGGELDVVVVPVGDGVILSGVAKGFRDLVQAGLLARMPRMIAAQAQGSTAIFRCHKGGDQAVDFGIAAITMADSLAVSIPANARLCLQDIHDSHGDVVVAPEDQIAPAIRELACYTGVFAEPAAATALASLKVALNNGIISADDRVALIATGNGLKDPSAISSEFGVASPIPPNMASLRQLLATETG